MREGKIVKAMLAHRLSQFFDIIWQISHSPRCASAQLSYTKPAIMQAGCGLQPSKNLAMPIRVKSRMTSSVMLINLWGKHADVLDCLSK